MNTDNKPQPAPSVVDAREVTRVAPAAPDGRDAVDAARWRAMRGHLDLLHVKHCVGYPGSTDDSDGYLSDIDAAADVVVAAMKRGE